MAILEIPPIEPRDNRRYDEQTGKIYHVPSYLSAPDILTELITDLFDPKKQRVLCSGSATVNCYKSVDEMIQQFEYIQEVNRVDSRGGKRAFQERLKFDDEEVKNFKLTAEDFWNMGMMCSDVYRLLGFQSIFAGHWDAKDGYHLHFIVNSFSFITGRKWNSSRDSFECRESYFTKLVDDYEQSKEMKEVMVM